MDYSYGFFAKQFPLCSNPNAVPMIMPRQTIGAIDEEEVPDMAVQSLPTVALESAEPSISPATPAGNVTGCRTIRTQLPSNPCQTKSDQSQPTPETPPPIIFSEVTLRIALCLKHKDCKNKDICYTCRAIEVQFTRLLKHCDPEVAGKMDSCSGIRKKLDLWHKASCSHPRPQPNQLPNDIAIQCLREAIVQRLILNAQYSLKLTAQFLIGHTDPDKILHLVPCVPLVTGMCT